MFSPRMILGQYCMSWGMNIVSMSITCDGLIMWKLRRYAHVSSLPSSLRPTIFFSKCPKFSRNWMKVGISKSCNGMVTRSHLCWCFFLYISNQKGAPTVLTSVAFLLSPCVCYAIYHHRNLLFKGFLQTLLWKSTNQWEFGTSMVDRYPTFSMRILKKSSDHLSHRMKRLPKKDQSNWMKFRGPRTQLCKMLGSFRTSRMRKVLLLAWLEMR